jgi:hypothetical protein
MHPGNVRKRLKELVADGWLIELQLGGGMGKTSRYRFVPVEKTAPTGALADTERVIQREQARSTARHNKRTQNELKKEEDSISNNHSGINDGKHTTEQRTRNTGGIANARAALTETNNNDNQQAPAHNDNNTPPPPNPANN